MHPAMLMAAKGVIVATSSADRSDTAPALAGPFTLREIVVMAGAVLLLIGSVLPFEIGKGSYANVWTYHTTAFNQFVTLALPLVLGAAFAWRRLSGRTRVTAGSLTLDQLASVVSLLGILYFFISSVMSMNPAFLLGLLGSLVMSAGTAAAPYIPGFVLDFVPGQEALLTRPIRPTERRGTSTAHGAPAPASSGHTPAAAGHGHTPAARPGHTAGGADAHVTVAGGLAATHSATPEPVPGAWPRPDVSEEPVAADPAADTAAQAPEGTAVPDTAGSHGTDGPAAQRPGTSPDAAPGEATADAAASGADAAGDESDATGTADAASSGGGADTTTAAGTGATAYEPDPATRAVPSTATSALPATGAGTDEGTDASSDTAASGNAEEEMSFTATSSGQDSGRQQAFWFAVPDRRTAVNEATGRNAFVLEPGEWILALEDRGYEFVVQDSDGTVGLLRDLGRIERA